MNVIATEPFPTVKTKPVGAKVEEPQPEKKADAPKEKLSGKTYEKALLKLQTELCYLQDWVRETGHESSSFSKAATRPARAA